MRFEPLLEFDRALGPAFSTSGLRGAFVPPADMVVTADEVKVFMDVPGLTADSLEIELENDVLTVRGERTMPYATTGNGDGRSRHASAAVERLDAGRLGVSAERVRQIEERALSKLRAGAHGARSGADAA